MAPTGLRNALGYSSLTVPFGVLLRTIFRTRRHDIPPLPEGPVILAPNHRSFIDPVVVASLVDRRIVFMMHAKYYDMPQLGWVYRMARCIAVEDGPNNRRALRDGKKVLDAGKVLTIFPEGTISPDGSLQPGQPGVAWLARKSGAPVFPVHLSGTREVLTKGSWRVHVRPVAMAVGKPRLREGYPPGREGDEVFTDALMADIAQLATTHVRL